MAAYWCSALFIISAVVSSLGYTFVESLFMASFFLPGMFLALYLHHRISLDASRRPLDMVYMSAWLSSCLRFFSRFQLIPWYFG